jgi:hypothetical protein
VGALAHVFEAAGLATVAFGSIREHLVDIAPPRAVFCDFPLGRPLGRPGDPAFQHRVLAQALDLVETATEPTLVDFPEAIHDDGTTALACPLPPRHDPDLHPAVDEARALRAAYDRGVARYGNRTGTGRVVAADDIPAAVESFTRVAAGTRWKEAGIAGIPARVAQDIRGYYEMAALVLADHTPAAWEGARWFTDATQAGATLRAAQRAMRDAGASRNVWFYLTPGSA